MQLNQLLPLVLATTAVAEYTRTVFYSENNYEGKSVEVTEDDMDELSCVNISSSLHGYGKSAKITPGTYCVLYPDLDCEGDIDYLNSDSPVIDKEGKAGAASVSSETLWEVVDSGKRCISGVAQRTLTEFFVKEDFEGGVADAIKYDNSCVDIYSMLDGLFAKSARTAPSPPPMAVLTDYLHP
ncbi:hypothetical protein O988_04701, partial [Pseudogymnoascus sp. VKM F-3808]